jgi:hypothetical protein
MSRSSLAVNVRTTYTRPTLRHSPERPTTILIGVPIVLNPPSALTLTSTTITVEYKNTNPTWIRMGRDCTLVSRVDPTLGTSEFCVGLTFVALSRPLTHWIALCLWIILIRVVECVNWEDRHWMKEDLALFADIILYSPAACSTNCVSTFSIGHRSELNSVSHTIHIMLHNDEMKDEIYCFTIFMIDKYGIFVL